MKIFENGFGIILNQLRLCVFLKGIFTNRPKGNDRSPETQQVKPSNIQNSSQERGVHFRHARTANSVVSGSIRLKFEIIQEIMHVFVTCKF